MKSSEIKWRLNNWKAGISTAKDSKLTELPFPIVAFSDAIEIIEHLLPYLEAYEIRKEPDATTPPTT